MLVCGHGLRRHEHLQEVCIAMALGQKLLNELAPTLQYLAKLWLRSLRRPLRLCRMPPASSLASFLWCSRRYPPRGLLDCNKGYIVYVIFITCCARPRSRQSRRCWGFCCHRSFLGLSVMAGYQHVKRAHNSPSSVFTRVCCNTGAPSVHHCIGCFLAIGWPIP